MSKNGKSGPAMVRAKDGYAFSVNGRNVVLRANELYAADDPVVLARPSLFERDDEASASPQLRKLLAVADRPFGARSEEDRRRDRRGEQVAGGTRRTRRAP